LCACRFWGAGSKLCKTVDCECHDDHDHNDVASQEVPAAAGCDQEAARLAAPWRRSKEEDQASAQLFEEVTASETPAAEEPPPAAAKKEEKEEEKEAQKEEAKEEAKEEKGDTAPAQTPRQTGSSSSSTKRLPMASPSAVRSWDFPLSRFEKKERLLHLFATDLEVTQKELLLTKKDLSLTRRSMGGLAAPPCADGLSDDSD
jgi:flagellar biosynthesis GTPase FlhF